MRAGSSLPTSRGRSTARSPVSIRALSRAAVGDARASVGRSARERVAHSTLHRCRRALRVAQIPRGMSVGCARIRFRWRDLHTCRGQGDVRGPCGELRSRAARAEAARCDRALPRRRRDPAGGGDRRRARTGGSSPSRCPMTTSCCGPRWAYSTAWRRGWKASHQNLLTLLHNSSKFYDSYRVVAATRFSQGVSPKART